MLLLWSSSDLYRLKGTLSWKWFCYAWRRWGIVTEFKGWGSWWLVLGSLVDQGVLGPVHSIYLSSPICPANSSRRSHWKLSSLVVNTVENSNQLISQASEISAAEPRWQLGFRVIFPPIAQFMQILKDMLKSRLQWFIQDAVLHVDSSGHLGRVWIQNVFQLRSSIFHCDRICSSTRKDLVFLAGLKPLSEKLDSLKQE